MYRYHGLVLLSVLSVSPFSSAEISWESFPAVGKVPVGKEIPHDSSMALETLPFGTILVFKKGYKFGKTSDDGYVHFRNGKTRMKPYGFESCSLYAGGDFIDGKLPRRPVGYVSDQWLINIHAGDQLILSLPTDNVFRNAAKTTFYGSYRTEGSLDANGEATGLELTKDVGPRFVCMGENHRWSRATPLTVTDLISFMGGAKYVALYSPPSEQALTEAKESLKKSRPYLNHIRD